MSAAKPLVVGAAAAAKKGFLASIMNAIREPYIKAAGWRQMGLRYDDLLMEENDVVQEALRRLSPEEKYARVYRIRRALHTSANMQVLPEKDHTKPHEDIHYLRPIIEQVQAEFREREQFDNFKPGLEIPSAKFLKIFK